MKRKLSLLLSVVMILSLLMMAGCSNGSSTPAGGETAALDKNRVVNVAYPQITDSFNASHNIGVPEAIAHSQVYDTLLCKHIDGSFRPSLAESYEFSEDGLTCTFHLRSDVKWSDGTDFTAKDVKATFDYYMVRPAYSGYYADFLESTEVIDDQTVACHLNYPNAVFIAYMSLPMYSSIMQADALEKWGDDIGTSVDKIIGTGPYTVTDWQNDVSITLKAKEDYFKGAPDVKNLVIHEITDTNAAIVAMQTGELDLYYAPITGSAFDTLSQQDNITIEQYVSCRNEGYYMYCRSGIFSDVRMRQAVAYAVSKEDAMTVAVDGMGTVIQYPGDIGPAMNGNPDVVPSITYNQDIDKAKALVEECGMTGQSVVIKSYNTEPYATLGTYLQSVLSEIGLDASVQQMERGTFISELESEQVSILPFCWVGSAYDIDEVLGASLDSTKVGSGANYSFYEDEEMDALIKAARSEFDPEKREAIYTQIIEKFMADCPFVSIYAVNYAIPHTSQLVTDNPISYSMFDYKWAE